MNWDIFLISLAGVVFVLLLCVLVAGHIEIYTVSKKKHNQQLRDAQRLIQYYKNQLQDADRAYERLAVEYRNLGKAFSILKYSGDSFRP